jgi:hypothetical protein
VVVVRLHHFFFELVHEQLNWLKHFIKQSIKRIDDIIPCVGADFIRPQIQLAVQLFDVFFADCSVA